MRIGLVRRAFATTGGAEAYLRRLAEGLVVAGHQPVLFSEEKPGADLWSHPHVAVGGRSPRAFADALRAANPKAHCDFLYSLERVWECDAYRAGDGVHASWLQRRTAHEPRWRTVFRGVRAKHNELLEIERELFTHGTRRIVANSHFVAREIAEWFPAAAEKTRVVHNGVPAFSTAPGTREKVRAELGLDPLRFMALFAGRDRMRKGLPYAHEAMRLARIAAPLLLVAGVDAPDEPRITHLGTRRDLPRLLAAADVFLLPTLYDAFSNACLEAVSAGLPVITTATNGAAEILDHQTGSIIGDASSVDHLARALEHWAIPAHRTAAKLPLAALAARHTVERNVNETLAALGVDVI